MVITSYKFKIIQTPILNGKRYTIKEIVIQMITEKFYAEICERCSEQNVIMFVLGYLNTMFSIQGNNEEKIFGSSCITDYTRYNHTESVLGLNNSLFGKRC